MAKVKILNLPPGITIKDGKVVKMKDGGNLTGDQSNYGLVTYPKFSGSINSDVLNVRHSLNAVPREDANLEAEGGETVLTDLDNDGLFGLYDIKGPRHSSGGVPLNLPEQSFIFSDTQSMKLGGSDLRQFGINSRKKITPAQVSKRYDLNQYYGKIKDDFADEIQVRSAELMMDKNKKTLSKLAFVQEAKKNFADGVPVIAHPYLISQNIDPIEFTARVEEISNSRALNKAMSGMSEQQLINLMMLQNMIEESNNQSVYPEPQQVEFDESFVQPPMAKYGFEYNEPLELYQKGKEKNQAFNTAALDDLKNLGIAFDLTDLKTAYENTQKSTKRGRFGSAEANEAKFSSNWKDIYPGFEALMKSLDDYTPASGNPADYFNPEVEKFQKWINTDYIPSQVNKINDDAVKAGRPALTEPEKEQLKVKLISTLGFNNQIRGQGVDGKFGTKTSATLPFKYKVSPRAKPPEVTEETDTPKTDKELKNANPELPRKRPPAQWWLQDLLQLNSIAGRNRDMFFPFQPDVPDVDMSYVLEDPTRTIAAINENLGQLGEAYGAFAGPQALSARMSQAQGKAAELIANEIGRVNQRNASTINQALARKAQFDLYSGRERRDRRVKEYDDTQTTLQKYMDERNYDREQYNMALNNAITNRANTYNLNSMQDYFSIDPTTGGVIGNFRGKAFEPIPISDPSESMIKRYSQLARDLKVAGIEPTGELMKFFAGLGQQPQRQETYAQSAYRSMPQGYGFDYRQPPGGYPLPFYPGVTNPNEDQQD